MMDDQRPLVAIISSDFDENDVARFQSIVGSLSAHKWSNGLPQFFDEVDDEGCTRPEDVPVRSVGCVLFFPTNAIRDQVVEQSSYSDVSSLIGFLKAYSRDTGVEFEIEIDRTYVGTIENGEANRVLEVGLLESWRMSI
ncbi:MULTISPECIES: hypothetical protein [Burkholderia]|nr:MULTISPECIES: hypothetical protein [Burkholderia]